MSNPVVNRCCICTQPATIVYDYTRRGGGRKYYCGHCVPHPEQIAQAHARTRHLKPMPIAPKQ